MSMEETTATVKGRATNPKKAGKSGRRRLVDEV